MAARSSADYACDSLLNMRWSDPALSPQRTGRKERFCAIGLSVTEVMSRGYTRTKSKVTEDLIGSEARVESQIPIAALIGLRDAVVPAEAFLIEERP